MVLTHAANGDGPVWTATVEELPGCEATGPTPEDAAAAARGQIERWLRGSAPSRTTRNEALLRVFFLWLLEADESAEYLDREAAYHRALLAELEQIAAAEEPVSAKDRAYRLALDYGLRTVRARLEWAEAAAAEVRSDERRDLHRED